MTRLKLARVLEHTKRRNLPIITLYTNAQGIIVSVGVTGWHPFTDDQLASFAAALNRGEQVQFRQFIDDNYPYAVRFSSDEA